MLAPGPGPGQSIQQYYKAMCKHPLKILSVLTHCEPIHRYTPLVEVNQADVAWSIGQYLHSSQQHLNHDMTMISEHDYLVLVSL